MTEQKGQTGISHSVDLLRNIMDAKLWSWLHKWNLRKKCPGLDMISLAKFGLPREDKLYPHFHNADISQTHGKGDAC